MTTRRHFLRTAATALPIGAALAAPQRPPHVVLLMADDQGWGDAGYQGHKILKTPHLDEMSKQSLRFDRFYAGAPVCSPTRGSCLTGRHPFRYGIYFANAGRENEPSQYALPSGEITLAEALKPAGYRSGHFGKWHLGDFEGAKKSSPTDAGFDEWFSSVRKVPTLDPTPGEYWENGKQVKEPLLGDTSKLIMDRALRFLERAVRDKTPSLTVIWMHTPHLPVKASSDFRAPYKSYSEAQQHYWGALAAMDVQVGRLRSALRQFGIARDTMLWYCSDNGPEGDQEDAEWPGTAGPLRGRKASLFEGGIRVPALLEWPSELKRPRTTAAISSTCDYFPTILEAAGLPLPSKRPIDGVSLMPLIRGRSSTRPVPLAFETTKITRGSPRLALIENRFKLLSNLEDKGDQLYDLTADPAEAHDLAAKFPADVQRMRDYLTRWRASCQRSNSGADYGANA